MSTEVWSQAVIGEKLDQWLGTLVAGRSELLLLKTIFKEWFFREASYCFYMVSFISNHNYVIRTTFLFLETQWIPYLKSIAFLGDLIQAFLFPRFSEWYVQRMPWTTRQLMLSYKRFAFVMRKSRRESLQYCSV